MASLPTRTTASFDSIKPVTSLVLLDDELNQLVGAAGFLNGGTTGKKLLVKTSDATDPPVDQDQIGAGLLARWKQNGSSKATITNDGSLTANGLTGAAGVYTFGSIPVGPASDPTTDNQLTRKAYVLARKTFFALTWFIADPSTYPLGSFNLAQKVRLPDGTTFTTTAAVLSYATGSASGSFAAHLEFHSPNAQGSPTSLGTININPGVVGAESFFTMNNANIAGKYVYVILDSRSSPLQRDLSITLHGEQVIH